MIQGFRNACCATLRFQCRFSSTDSQKAAAQTAAIKSEWRRRRNVIFDNEKQRQQSEIGRIEKVAVKYLPWDKDEAPIEMRMNKHLSTPYDCTKHLTEDYTKTVCLALVDRRPWDLQKPFEQDCELELITMAHSNKSPVVNTAFWRSCSLLMGCMVEASFKDEIQVYLHSFPKPDLKSGSFTYDAVIDLPDWKPTQAELRAMSAAFVKLSNQESFMERLEVSEELALDMFQDNPFKNKQIPNIAQNHNGKIVLYRIGDFIDISQGPMVGSTGIIGKATIASVHKVESNETDRLYRFQGVALPKGTRLNHFAWSVLEKDARKFNDLASVTPVRESVTSAPTEVVSDEEKERSSAAN
ncbi:hypothetical protein TKK_0015897 [Trichogramma kaykai]